MIFFAGLRHSSSTLVMLDESLRVSFFVGMIGHQNVSLSFAVKQAKVLLETPVKQMKRVKRAKTVERVERAKRAKRAKRVKNVNE